MMAAPSGQPTAQAEDTEDEELDEVQHLLAHRTLGLLDLGFSIEQTLLLVHRNDVVHDAEYLLKLGASHEFVMAELT